MSQSGIVAFDYAAWALVYPEFAATVNEAQADGCFATACAFLNNTATSPVQNLPLRTQMLWLITAHVAQILYGSSLQANGMLVGQISAASEGSVNVTLVQPKWIGNAAFFNQTKYGSMYWAMTAPYRLFQYRSGPYVPIVPVIPPASPWLQ